MTHLIISGQTLSAFLPNFAIFDDFFKVNFEVRCPLNHKKFINEAGEFSLSKNYQNQYEYK